MILTDEMGNEVDYFERFPKDLKHIAISLSGGTDSALILFCLMKMIYERGMQHDVTIHPIHGYDIGRKNIHSYEAAERIIEFIEDYWVNYNIIRPLHIFAYDKGLNKKLSISKEQWHQANYEYLKRRYNIPFVIRGITQGMPDSDRPLETGDSSAEKIKEIAKNTWALPFGTVDKKFIAHQYKVFKLKQLYRLTSSCTEDRKDPCRKCWWCKEKYWAFGSYDGGIQ